LRVLIVGGGISGLTLAAALQRARIDVDLVEIRTDLSQQAGVGLSLQGNCIAALARIGVAAECMRRGMPGNYLNLRKPDGTLMTRQPLLPMGGPGFPGTTGIARNDLHEILYTAALAAGANVRLGTTVAGFEAAAEGVAVRFSDGPNRHYDLLVGADGVNSATRTTLFSSVRPAPCGQSVWRAGVSRPKGNFTTELHFGGPFGVVGVCPISTESAYLYLVEAADPSVRFPEAALASIMSEKLEPYTSPMVRACVEQLPESRSISYRPLEWLLLPSPWFKGRALILGDAAHCNPPVLAQGAAMGIEDAILLSELLSDEAPIDAALVQFSARRFPRASLVVNNSVQLCEWEVKHLVGPQEVGRLMFETQKALAQPF
jgi:2-polyprenyl-6-methoxyphenol hydroxylase-like FAD-dependent oxidoreductase